MDTNISQNVDHNIEQWFEKPTEQPNSDKSLEQELEDILTPPHQETEVVETPPAADITEDLVEVVPETNKTQTVKSTYTELISHFVSTGEWEDVDVEIDGNKIPITEIADIDKETFLELKALQDSAKKEELSQKYVNVEGIGETERNIIEIVKNNGDVTSILEKKPTIDAILQLEATRDPQALANLVAEKMKHANYEDEYIRHKISSLIQQGNLDTEAQTVIDEIKTNFNNYVLAEKAKAENARQSKELERQELRKKVLDASKNMQLKDAIRKTLVDTSTKYDAEGKTELDRLLEKTRLENPLKLMEIALLLKDEDAFNSYKITPAKNQATVESARRVMSIAPREGRKTLQTKQKDVIAEWFDEQK